MYKETAVCQTQLKLMWWTSCFPIFMESNCKFCCHWTDNISEFQWEISCTWIFVLFCVCSKVCYTSFIIIKFFYSLWSTGHPWRASMHCGLQLSPWPHSMIFLCSLSHPLLSFATFSLACLSFYIPEDSNIMQFSLLLLFLYVMCVRFNSIFFFLSDFLLTSEGDSP